MKKNNTELEKELFNELPQLDRIEYRQKLKNIEEAFSKNPFIYLSFIILFLSLMVTFFEIIVYKIDGSIVYNISLIIGSTMLGIYLYVFGIIYSVFNFYRKDKYKKELNEEYFTLKVSK